MLQWRERQRRRLCRPSSCQYPLSVKHACSISRGVYLTAFLIARSFFFRLHKHFPWSLKQNVLCFVCDAAAGLNSRGQVWLSAAEIDISHSDRSTDISDYIRQIINGRSLWSAIDGGDNHSQS